MSTHKYPVSSLRSDYLRACAGIVFTSLMLVGASSIPVVSLIVGSILFLFVGFGFQTWNRHLTTIRIDGDGLNVYGLRRRKIQWQQLTGAKLRFFTMKRDRNSGWMELTLLTENGKYKIDSSIQGFNKIAQAVVHSAEANNVVIDKTSVENFNGIGIQTKSSGLPEAAKRFDKFDPWQNNM